MSSQIDTPLTVDQCLSLIDQERLDFMAEGMTAVDCDTTPHYVIADEYRKLKRERDELLAALQDIHDNPDGARLKAAAAIEKFRSAYDY